MRARYRAEDFSFLLQDATLNLYKNVCSSVGRWVVNASAKNSRKSFISPILSLPSNALGRIIGLVFRYLSFLLQTFSAAIFLFPPPFLFMAPSSFFCRHLSFSAAIFLFLPPSLFFSRHLYFSAAVFLILFCRHLSLLLTHFLFSAIFFFVGLLGLVLNATNGQLS